MSSSSHNFEEDEGAKRPIPSFDTSSIKLSTLGIGDTEDSMPDYLEYDTSGRGLMQTMFANAGLSYLLGTLGGGIYGFNEGLKHTPSHRFRVKLNSVLNHCSRHGSRFGNMLGVWSVMYSFYENFADQVRRRLWLWLWSIQEYKYCTAFVYTTNEEIAKHLYNLLHYCHIIHQPQN
mmetsp:Transcript_8785/g.13111  ORF Transcript_8785/g.13111 Transcript_8785/m.13111 type:complete len:176 (-) Transcript_8785:112-639(-)